MKCGPIFFLHTLFLHVGTAQDGIIWRFMFCVTHVSSDMSHEGPQTGWVKQTPFYKYYERGQYLGVALDLLIDILSAPLDYNISWWH